MSTGDQLRILVTIFSKFLLLTSATNMLFIMIILMLLLTFNKICYMSPAVIYYFEYGFYSKLYLNVYKEINIITEEIEYIEVLSDLKADFIIGYDLKALVLRASIERAVFLQPFSTT